VLTITGGSQTVNLMGVDFIFICRKTTIMAIGRRIKQMVMDSFIIIKELSIRANGKMTISKE
jgi:hypothetical protein